jgi:hypothetical protein
LQGDEEAKAEGETRRGEEKEEIKRRGKGTVSSGRKGKVDEREGKKDD